VAGIDSVLAVLSAEAGAYKLADGKIYFEDAAASRQYGELRRRVDAAVDAARIAGGEQSAGPMGHLMSAIGTTRLPVES
jgi:cysteinyl-tRNA synthetase